MVQQKRQSEQVSGVSNLAYDLVALLNNKLDGIAALEIYKQDAQGNQQCLSLFEELQKREVEDVNRIKGLVTQELGQ